MHRPPPLPHPKLPPTMIQTPHHNHRLPRLQTRIHNPRRPIRPKIRLLVPPQVAPRHDARGAVVAGGVAGRDEEAEQHVAVGVVGGGGRVAGVVVLVVAVEGLGGGAGAEGHGDGDGEEGGGGVVGGGGGVPAAGVEGEEVVDEVLVTGRCWPMGGGDLRGFT